MSLSELDLPRPRGKAPRPVVDAEVGDEVAPPLEAAQSLRPTASAAEEPKWSVHDRTHVEFSIEYPLRDGPTEYVWESYYFVPESFRLDEATYDKKEMYEDLLSYVRLTVPRVDLEELASRRPSAPLGALEASLGADGASDAVDLARSFACMVRSATLDAQRQLLRRVREEPARGAELARRYVASVSQPMASYRELLADRGACGGDAEKALAWIDEDLSLALEALAASASVELRRWASGRGDDDPFAPAEKILAAHAVAEARWRAQRGYPSAGSAHATPRDLEHLEFRRRVLRRFTSSVLWLRHEVRPPAVWILHALYGLAAAVAMAFAVWATLRATEWQGTLTLYFAVLVASYAVKDRMKAVLQQSLTSWFERQFEDRRWTIRAQDGAKVGAVLERGGFRPAARLPAPVLAIRRRTREHALEELARPERVLWHQKTVRFAPRRSDRLAAPTVTEVFRLNLAPWLEHTDDANREIAFADPTDAKVYAGRVRRVYNVNVVYRLRSSAGDEPFRRVRIVVSRKGVERIDPIV